MYCDVGEPEAHVEARQHVRVALVERVRRARAGAVRLQRGRQPALDVGGLVGAVVSRVAGALARGQRVVVPVRRREADVAVAVDLGPHEAHADVAHHVHAAEVRLGSAESQHQVRRLALLAHVEDFGCGEAALARHVRRAVAKRVPALRCIDVAVGESFGVQVVVAQRGAVQEYQRTSCRRRCR